MAPSVHVDDDVDAADDTSPSLRGRLEVSTAAPQVDQLSVAWPGKASSFPASPACSTPTELEGQSGDSEELGAGSGLLTFVQGDDDLPPVVLKAKGRAATYSLSGVRNDHYKSELEDSDDPDDEWYRPKGPPNKPTADRPVLQGPKGVGKPQQA